MTEPDDLDEWLDVLAGRKSAPPTDDAARVRKILIEQDRWIEESIRANHPSDELALEELRYRLQRARFSRRTTLRRYALPLAVAATVLLAVNLIYFQPWNVDHGTPVPTSSEAPFVDSNGSNPVPPSGQVDEIEIRQASPGKVVDALSGELTQAGIPSAVAKEGGRYRIECVVGDQQTLILGNDVLDAAITLGPGRHVIYVSEP